MNYFTKKLNIILERKTGTFISHDGKFALAPKYKTHAGYIHGTVIKKDGHWLKPEQQYQTTVDAKHLQFVQHTPGTKTQNLCPECGTPGQIPGVKCPNCDSCGECMKIQPLLRSGDCKLPPDNQKKPTRLSRNPTGGKFCS